MSPLILKELRENFKAALIGLALYAFLLAEIYRSCTSGGRSWSDNGAQPLLADLNFNGFACAIFGALLGWLQIHNERHRDLWAFLVHRPLSRTKIFAAKAAAGLSLYTVGAGLPLLGFIVMTRIPGHIAAPFEWAMVLPLLAFFLTGMLFYFAGLLTGLRQARWYASRGLGLGAACVVCLAMANAPEFSRALVIILVAGALLATAAWGSFLSHGYYAGQPAAGQRALTASLMLGCLIVVGLAMILIESMLPHETYTWSRQQITKDGGIYQETQTAGQPIEITDHGAPLVDAATGRPITAAEFNRRIAPESSLRTHFPDPAELHYQPYGRYQQSSRYFVLCRQTPDTLWYWARNGRLLSYDIASRRFTGSLGPDGFVPGKTTGADRFSRPHGPFENGYFDRAQTLMTDHAVYLPDLEHRTVRPFFTATNNDLIGGAVDISTRDSGWEYTLVVTKQFIQLLTPDGKWVWQIPYTPGYPAYDSIAVSFLEPSNRFAVCINPVYRQTNQLPSQVFWVAAGQGVFKQQAVPSYSQSTTPSWQERLAGLGMPPAFLPVVGWLYGWWSWSDLLWQQLRLIILAGALICAAAGWWLGRRYHFTVATQLKWAVYHLLTGLPGLLGFLCVQEWPASEPCTACKKLRLVDREQCEHCGAEFAPPPRNGIEVFAESEPG